jgi:hypothetical protein
MRIAAVRGSFGSDLVQTVAVLQLVVETGVKAQSVHQGWRRTLHGGSLSTRTLAILLLLRRYPFLTTTGFL